jgi:hypothetical protein
LNGIAKKVTGLVLALVCSALLASCSDPIKVGLLGPVSEPTVLLDPCRHGSYDTVEWYDADNDHVFWRIEFDHATTDRSMVYGRVPSGSRELSRPSALEQVRSLLVRFSLRHEGYEVAAGEFALGSLQADRVLQQSGSTESDDRTAWTTCQE